MNEAKAIQVCGTGSGVGKSVITAALCRIFLEDGLKVAPFKSQNMALNSFVTEDGGEIARAQAIQAYACQLKPTTDMNPILIKPSSDTLAQIILQGKPVGNMSVYQYKEYKKLVYVKVKESLRRLQNKYEVVVIEGAGSPAEINLKKHDLVNLRIAALAKAPVILVGDIDKGGVFASLVGTLQLLDEKERSMVKGFIINKFRGDQRLLRPGIRFLEKYTGIKVLGILPYFLDIRVPEEDSLPPQANKKPLSNKTIKISVIYLQHISNFTDFDALQNERDVRLNFARSCRDLYDPDIIIIPGSKNTIGDLSYLKKCGLADKIVSLARSPHGPVLVGICGGYQMLGRVICDRENIESKHRKMSGLGILPIVTEMRPEKILCQVKARHLPSGREIIGYEIHHGRTRCLGKVKPLFKISRIGGGLRQKYDGVASADGRCWGTYIHGVFDHDAFRRHFLNSIRIRKGWLPLAPGEKFNTDGHIAKLAKLVRANLDMDSLYNIMGIGRYH